ncbi:hypothetical protein [Rhodococcus ruber]|uniref:hypothetical protein n=1 Tax=Rhodococcus ruber TaxID=1830 RepID=UPI0037845A24
MRYRSRTALIAFGAGFPAGVAITVAGESIPVFWATVIGSAGLAFMMLARRRGGDPDGAKYEPGRGALLMFFVWATITTIIAPTLFEGRGVLIPRLGIDDQVHAPGALDYTISNAAQVAYLGLAVLAVHLIARDRRMPTYILGVPLALMTVLSLGRLLALRYGLDWPHGFFDNAPNRTFIERTSTGEKRFRGIFAEPSTLATYSIVTIVFFTKALPSMGVRGRRFSVAIILAAATNAAVSTAGTMVAGGLLVVAAICGVSVFTLVTQRRKIQPWAVIATCVAAAAVLVGAQWLYEYVASAVQAKVGSGSFASRTGADAYSIQSIFVDTWGVGVGLGSSRPSSFWPMMLSSVGLIGTLLFVMLVVKLSRAAWKTGLPAAQASVWALVALLLCKSVAGPNLSDPFLWLTLGVLAHFAWTAQNRLETTVAGADSPVRVPAPA